MKIPLPIFVEKHLEEHYGEFTDPVVRESVYTQALSFLRAVVNNCNDGTYDMSDEMIDLLDWAEYEE